ncbi:hypothetical protein C0V75_19755 [Tabrizicola sp. TH137]|uniref:hypothetical protein n=1 Tax=Tabrizicola sp. TH137 TaxID=2067452 RepID=UPI000C7C97B2|nr:hypothetical protein [Tabrizicola sp. TH137]PLL10565.1 hypothetical protein C0V75_19755 [Tabrizicola sp. TH137]
MMRWWPPLLHLSVLVVILPLAWERIEVLRAGPEIAPVAEGPAGETAVQDLAALMQAGEAVTPAALLARPLFTPGRQGDAAEVPETPVNEEATEAEVPRMVGYVNDGSRPRAILASEAGGEEGIVREGDEFLGFTVLQVKPDAVVLRGDGEEITVKMFPQ